MSIVRLRKASYQAVPIHGMLADILPDIPIHHHFRDHRTLAGLGDDVDTDEL